MEKIKSCPICSNTEYKPFLKVKDWSISKEDFYIVQCNGCGLAFTNPRPSEEEIGSYYESNDYISHSDTNTGFINKIYQLVKTFTIRQKTEMVASRATKRALLDIGCGTGDFIGAFKSKGWTVSGVEPNSIARSSAEKKYSIVPSEKFESSKYVNGSLGVITMWHVLEHVHRLDYYLNSCYDLLDKNGLLIIAVPNLSSYDAQNYKEHWAAYDVPRHIWHFTPDTLMQLCKRHGFELKETLPMWFDSFYVSMLSEKYKNGGNILRAMILGFLSNLKALYSQGTCSSHIYIYVKK
jgi:2-polyprenyl-3-methyl-5-hydroxy-6-metoxy-1,4-benzoquinol methylase